MIERGSGVAVWRQIENELADAIAQGSLAAGERLQIRALGLVTIADDVTPELALATIESIHVLGALHASTEVKAALAGRIR